METRGNHVRPAWGNGKTSFCKGDSDSTRRGEAHRVSVRIRAAGRSADLSGKRPEGRQGDAFPPSGGEKEGKPSDGEKGLRSLTSRRLGSSDAEIHWGVPRSPITKKRMKRPGYAKGKRQPMGTVLLSVGAALVLGTIMGFSVLTLFFSDDPALSSRSIDAHLERNPAPEEKAASEERKSAFSLADLNAVLIQGGSFAEKERAQQAIQSHRSKGRAGVMTDASPHRIFLGVAKNRDDALKLSVIYQKENVDVYLKDLKVKGDGVRLSEEAMQAAGEDLSRFVEDGHRIFQTLAESTASFLGSSSPAGFPDPKGLEEVHRRMMDAGTRLEKQLPSGARPHLQDLMMAADQAVQSAREASRNPSAALAWQAQEGLVRYALAYEALVSSLK
ncbi:hypothetical protein SAMN04488025_10880 [Planifilum fulgidum]|jgi:stage II sporulation protein B|uniref:Stage II sporulation protein B n=1 Tax=Planifilum fulgidum TaxID=201973 RepID=A0A1I2MK81_9BACL|nr:hypothetical protein [Bacillota bacterium]MBO2533888.1 hypothetical protein [Thermoactinomycetaceae bacterium]SFF91119.1 hypothetical protein SAMN04488025_10880 [Planifilum fulgidum]